MNWAPGFAGSSRSRQAHLGRIPARLRSGPASSPTTCIPDLARTGQSDPGRAHADQHHVDPCRRSVQCERRGSNLAKWRIRVVCPAQFFSDIGQRLNATTLIDGCLREVLLGRVGELDAWMTQHVPARLVAIATIQGIGKAPFLTMRKHHREKGDLINPQPVRSGFRTGAGQEDCPGYRGRSANAAPNWPATAWSSATNPCR